MKKIDLLLAGFLGSVALGVLLCLHMWATSFWSPVRLVVVLAATLVAIGFLSEYVIRRWGRRRPRS
jgi:hypothetical protein